MAGEHTGTSANETLAGETGTNTFVFDRDNGNDVVTGFTNGEDLIELSAFPTISSFSDLTITSGDNGVTIDLTEYGGGTILLQGFDLDDLDASDFVFRINQTLEGDEDNNFLYGDTGDDTFYGHAGNDKMWGYAGNDTLYGGEGNDILYGDAVDDPADYADDVLHGDGGNDRLFGGGGSDTLYGGEGDDFLYGDPARDGVFEGQYTGDDALYGGAGNDFLYGDSSDQIGEGDDTLDGGTGDDVMWGGAGDDTFVFAAGHGNDTIRDFTDGDDLIDLSQISDITGFGDLTITADGTTVVIDLTAHGGGTIRLENFSVNDLDAADFEFYEPPVDPGVDGI